MTKGPVRPGLHVALLAAASASGEIGGAERFYADLHQALRSAGCTVDLIPVQTDESSFEAIVDGYERCRAMDLSAYDLVISTKSPTFNVRHRRHVVFLVHTVRVFYDQFDTAFPTPTPQLLEQRRHIQQLDTQALGAAARRFAIGYEVAHRLRRFNGLDAEVLHLPLGSERFRPQPAEDFFFLPGRLHPWKRVDLVIRAVLSSREPLRLVIAGTGEAEADLRSLAGGDPRIEFLGRIDDERLIDLYGRCLAVPFVPVREDYGYVTLEAFASGKPVITCNDSGEPLQFVAHGCTGWVCEPTPESIRDAMQACRRARAEAQSMGERGREIARRLAWPAVVERLLRDDAQQDGPMRSAGRAPSDCIRVAVLDMQPITPAIGGGRLRLLGLYHALGADFETRYVGSYDWPGEHLRRQQLTSTLEELVVPLSDDHHAAAGRLSAAAGGKTVIDIAFPRLGHLSADYLAAARDAVDWAEVVVFSHPWVYPLVAERVRLSQLVVYDSHNVEGFLRGQLLDRDRPVERDLLRDVLATEYRLGSRADVVLACSHEDRERFWRVYEWPFAKMRVVPNGVMATQVRVATAAERERAKRALGLDPERRAAIFIGSPYRPNVEAATFIAQQLAPALPEMDFVIAGGVGAALQRPLLDNVRVTGQIDDVEKQQWLAAADFGVNPMFSGSGTNIKMFDLMAAGLPTVTTVVGARGIERAGRKPFLVCEPDASSLSAALRRLCADPELAAQVGRGARECVEDGYAWERISPALGNLLRCRLRREAAPFFSVVIPTYERHAQLDALLARLEAQTDGDFEVIVVDQSTQRWPNEHRKRPMRLTYVHTDVRGAVRARNTGADLARGQVIAFTDDDCLPQPDWLQSARQYFEASSIAGVEGAIESDHLDDPAYRPVTNIGFESIGFMTANLFVRVEAFHRLAGFDLDFDRPHFREDTDFGWRLQELGDVPYARDVRVFHPAQPRSIERESQAQRARFFEKDALLLAKHPRRYRELFEKEGHWHKTPGFWEHFERGARDYGVDVSEYVRRFRAPTANSGTASPQPVQAAVKGAARRDDEQAMQQSTWHGHKEILQGQFVELLREYKPIDLGRRPRAVDLVFAYRLLLGRMPRDPEELQPLLGWTGTWREFLQQLLASAEFRLQLGFLPAGLQLMSQANGFRFWFASDDREMGARMAAGAYELATVDLLGRVVRQGMRCLDVGAQTGFYTCQLARLVGPTGRVFAFEPMARSFELLCRNIEENGWNDRVSLRQVACADVGGRIEASIASGMVVAGGHAESIEAVRLDDLDLAPIDFCKIDVEGFEPRVILGMRDLLAKCMPVLITEFNEYWLRQAGSSSAAYGEMLSGFGYRLFDIDNSMREVIPDAPRDELENVNVLAVPVGRLDEVLGSGWRRLASSGKTRKAT